VWRALPTTGKPIREVRIEGTGRDRDLVLIPVQGQRLRLLATGDINIETGGRVMIRTTPIDLKSLRVTFSGSDLVLAQSEVFFEGGDDGWQRLWRQAQMRSRPWWNETEGDELDLDLPMQARLKIVGPT
jgi:hypothetical protein